jgi:tetratricopeptide (TPR) repeat protein
MFVFLALVFAVGFVIFGVGSDVPGGVADILGGGGGGSAGQPSIDDARERLEKNPADPAALRDLAEALRADGRPEESIKPLADYVRIRPKDEEALQELANLYLTRAARLQGEAQLAQYELQTIDPRSQVLPRGTTPFAQALGPGPVVEAVSSRANERLNNLIAQLRSTFEQAKAMYQRIAQIAPDDPTVQIQLADTAINAGDTTTALAAYKRFLRLAPDDPTAPDIRQRVKQLEQIGS